MNKMTPPSASLLAMVLMLTGLPGCSGGSPGVLESSTTSLEFDTEVGTFHVESSSPELSISDAYATVETTLGSFSTTDSRYRRTSRLEKTTDGGESASRLIVECIDSEKVLDLRLELTLYDSGALNLKTLATNRSTEPLQITEIRPLATGTDGAGVRFANPLDLAISTEAYMFTDQGTVTSFAQDPQVASWWSILLADPASGASLLVGYLDHHNGEGILRVSHPPTESGDSSQFSLTAHSTLLVEDWVRDDGDWGTDTTKAWGDLPDLRSVTLPAGSSLDSDTLTVQLGHDPFDLLESYAARVSRANSIELPLPVASGWVSWDYYRGAVTEEDVLANASFMAEHMAGSGVQYVQVDDGWQVHRGVWEPYEPQFPHGMKWLADRIKEKGLRPGIWLAPFQVIETAPLFLDHPEWFLKNPDGSPLVCGESWLAERSEASRQVVASSGREPSLHALDVTHPEARRWLHDLFQRLSQDWGYEFFKIDFVYSSLMLSDGFFDPTVTKAQANRIAYKTIREAVGEKSYVLDCGPRTSIGLVDAWRLNLDSAPTWSNLTMSSGQIRAVGRRYYMNNALFYSDPDMLMLRPPLSTLDSSRPRIRRELERQESNRGYGQDGLTESQARSIASLIALSGGQVMSSDNLTVLPEERFEILQRILPVYGVSARSVDFFDRDYSSIFHLEIEKDFGGWDIVGLFNWGEDEPATRSLDLEKIGLTADDEYVVYELWSDRFLGTVRDRLSFSVDPTSSMILSLHKKPKVPWILSTNRHLTQGGVDLLDVEWDGEARVLRGTSQAMSDFGYEMVVYVPERFRLTKASSLSIACPVKEIGQNVYRVGIPSGRDERFDWQVEFTEDQE